MDFNTQDYAGVLAATKKIVAEDTSGWQSTLVLRYTKFLTTQVNQRQDNLNLLMARSGLTSDIVAMRLTFHDAEQAEIDAIKIQLGSISEVTAMITDPVATEAMLRIYAQAGGM